MRFRVVVAVVALLLVTAQGYCWTGVADEQIAGATTWNAVATVVSTSEEYWNEAYNRTPIPTSGSGSANATVLAASGPLWDEGYHFQLTPTPSPNTLWAAAATAVAASEAFWDEAYNRTAVPTQDVSGPYAASTVVATSEEFWDAGYHFQQTPTPSPVPTYSLSAGDIQTKMLNQDLDLGTGDLAATQIDAASVVVSATLTIGTKVFYLVGNEIRTNAWFKSLQDITALGYLAGANLTVTHTADLQGGVELGDAVDDQIDCNGRVGTDIDPITDSTYALGSPTLAWATATVDVLELMPSTGYVDNAIVSGASAALATGDYITLTHNLGTNNIMACSWIIPATGTDSGKPINGEGCITIRQEDTNTVWMRNDGAATVNMFGCVFRGK